MMSKTMLLIAISATLLSVAATSGGEGFEISLNNKMMIQRFGGDINATNSLQLNQSLSGGQLTIKYHHCGRVGKNRIVTLKDSRDKIVKEWRYADVATPVAAMTCNVKDILSVKKAGNNVFKLYYSSSELPNGRLLTNVVLGNNVAALR